VFSAKKLRSKFRRRELGLCAVALLLLAFLGLNRGLWTPDEPREAEISREMALAPTIIPTLNGEPFIEKPPLYYWTVALAYRAAGEPSALAARMVSVMAALATLLLIFVWAARAHSATAGIVASLMLATSLQFAISTHWVLIDPLLMLFTTGAAWAAWELLAGKSAWRLQTTLYAALALALWTKGLIGPVLIGAGLTAYICLQRPAAWRNLRPGVGVTVLGAALALLAAAIWHEGGKGALWEWGWVNHVQRLTNPGKTGHRQPLLYYFWTLPYAVLPWLLPFIDALRPSNWRDRSERLDAGAVPGRRLLRYCAILSAAMLLVLSISATKRETYLLPLLPLIFLGLGVHVADWWRSWRQRGSAPLGVSWWLQTLLLGVFVLAPPVLVSGWQQRSDVLTVSLFLLGLLGAGLLLRASCKAQRTRAGILALANAVIATSSLLVLAAHAFDGMKDMTPFAASVGHELPPGMPVYTTAMDESLQGIVPFATGRRLIAVDPGSLSDASSPGWILVQDNHDGRITALPPAYALERSQSFGPGRVLQLWRRKEP